MQLFTIGFTKKPASSFFHLLRKNQVRTLVDVRLNNQSQLAGFSKKDDLAFFLDELCGINYIHEPLLSPSEDILKAYKNKNIDWNEYEIRFNRLLVERKAEFIVDMAVMDKACFLCSEHNADNCHRRLVVEYLANNFHETVNIKHLK